MNGFNHCSNDRDGLYLCAREAAKQGQQRQPQQQQGTAHSSAVLALKGGSSADEITEALRHAGDHLLIALSLVHPAVDL